MKKLINIIVMLICSFGINMVVYASAHPVYIEGEGTDTYGLKSSYSSFKKTEVSSTNTPVLLYGKSVCSGSSCNVTYAASQNSKFKDALANAVTCTNGEQYLIYQESGTQNLNYLSDNKSGLNGTVYWDHEFYITCTNDSTKSDLIQTKNEVTTTTESTTTSSGEYSTGDSVQNEPTGINTYFAVLSVVALISYVFMIIVKKYNLFKNI